MSQSQSPCFNVAYDQDVSDECTIAASNDGHPSCKSNLLSDERTAITQFSRDIENENEVDDANTKIQAGVFIPQHAMPLGGVSNNTIAAKWEQRVKEQAQ